MVRALLAGTKTQTRRAVKRPERFVGGMQNCAHCCPYGQSGDRLWVRETWMPDAPRNGEWPDVSFYGCGMSPLSDIPECYRHPWHCLYRATHYGCELVGWKPGMHMPRWASRILLEVTEVRVERLQDISEADAIAEGLERTGPAYKPTLYAAPIPGAVWETTASAAYRTLWESINGLGSWDANPWVWAVSFRHHHKGEG